MKKVLSTGPVECWAPTIKNLKLHGAKHRQWTGMLAMCTKILTWVSVCGLKDSKALKCGTLKILPNSSTSGAFSPECFEFAKP